MPVGLLFRCLTNPKMMARSLTPKITFPGHPGIIFCLRLFTYVRNLDVLGCFIYNVNAMILQFNSNFLISLYFSSLITARNANKKYNLQVLKKVQKSDCKIYNIT